MKTPDLLMFCRREAQQTDQTGVAEQVKKHLDQIGSLRKAMHAQNEKAEKNIEAMKQQMLLKQNQANARHKKVVGGLESQMAALNLRYNSKEKEMAKLQKMTNSLRSTNKDLRAKCERHEEAMKKSKAETTLISDLRNQILQLKTRCSHLQTSYDVERRQNTQLEGRLKEHENEEDKVLKGNRVALHVKTVLTLFAGFEDMRADLTHDSCGLPFLATALNKWASVFMDSCVIVAEFAFI